MFSSLFQNILGRETLIAPDDNWALMVFMYLAVAVAIFLEQKYDWESKISCAIIALIFSLIASNLAIIPTFCVIYDDIMWGFTVPMSIPLLLLQCNIKRIWKETGCSTFSSARCTYG